MRISSPVIYNKTPKCTSSTSKRTVKDVPVFTGNRLFIPSDRQVTLVKMSLLEKDLIKLGTSIHDQYFTELKFRDIRSYLEKFNLKPLEVFVNKIESSRLKAIRNSDKGYKFLSINNYDNEVIDQNANKIIKLALFELPEKYRIPTWLNEYIVTTHKKSEFKISDAIKNRVVTILKNSDSWQEIKNSLKSLN